jgi:hypothetical protein
LGPGRVVLILGPAVAGVISVFVVIGNPPLGSGQWLVARVQ